MLRAPSYCGSKRATATVRTWMACGHPRALRCMAAESTGAAPPALTHATAIAQKTRDCRADRLTLLRNACRAGPGLWTGPARAQGQGGGTSRDAPSALGGSPSLCQRPRWERCSTPRVGSITWPPPLRCVSGSPATAVAIQTNQKRGSARECPSSRTITRPRARDPAAAQAHKTGVVHSGWLWKEGPSSAVPTRPYYVAAAAGTRR